MKVFTFVAGLALGLGIGVRLGIHVRPGGCVDVTCIADVVSPFTGDDAMLVSSACTMSPWDDTCVGNGSVLRCRAIRFNTESYPWIGR